jgi:hypothetical protein
LYNYKGDFRVLANSVRPEITSSEVKASVRVSFKSQVIQKKNYYVTYEQVNTAIVAEGDRTNCDMTFQQMHAFKRIKSH